VSGLEVNQQWLGMQTPGQTPGKFDGGDEVDTAS